MFNLEDNDNELDKKSREAAAGFVSSATPPAWDIFVQQLNQAMPINKRKRRFFYWWVPAAIAVVLGVSTYFIIQKSSNISKVSPAANIEIPAAAVAILPIHKEKQNTANKATKLTTDTQKTLPYSNKMQQEASTALVTKKGITRTKEDKIHAENNGNSNKKKIKLSLAAPNNSGTTNRQNNIALISSNNTAHRLTKLETRKPILKNKLVDTTEVVAKYSDKKQVLAALSLKKEQKNEDDVVLINNTNFKGTTTATATPSKTLLTNKIEVLDCTHNFFAAKDSTKKAVIASLPRDTSLVATKDTTNKKSKKHTLNAFSIETVGTSDVSTVKFTYINKASYGGGAIIGYHFNKKWSIHTGAIYTQKNYKAAGSDFTLPKSSWLRNYKIEDVVGYCRMWDVPLVVRYTVKETQKASFFISAGLSSYFMKKENYSYAYYIGGNKYTYNASYSNSPSYLLSIADFSIGMDEHISPHFNLHIEPYAKLPLKGIGFGSMQISSYGLNLALQYKRLLHK
ncbi:hypothetical protein [Parasediminibacterium sp. JCM 36343]|uniref:hypothetical protein n=1 Tax=Parasediminibacterium sp. JCM 36343 TaxID=3374279 RepID=UPI00397AA3A2